MKGGGTTDQSMWAVNLNSNYYFMTNFGAGLILEYTSQDIDSVENKTTEIGPVLVYNFSMNEMVSLPVFGALTYASNDNSVTDKYSGWGWLIGAGVKYFMNDNISLNGTVDYGQQYLTHDVGPDLDIKGFSVKGGLSVYFGGI
jgi:outer membrane protein W